MTCDTCGSTEEDVAPRPGHSFPLCDVCTAGVEEHARLHIDEDED